MQEIYPIAIDEYFNWCNRQIAPTSSYIPEVFFEEWCDICDKSMGTNYSISHFRALAMAMATSDLVLSDEVFEKERNAIEIN